jgi:aryl-alcohol dehydrogenase-like predicted oxidoreductase
VRYTVLGRSGLRVSEICLGTMTFGTENGWGADKSESQAIFDAFAEAGGNFVDTADVYTAGTSERWVGEFVASERGRFVVGTKYTMSRPAADPNAAGNQRKHMVQALEASLRRLNTDYVDLYWVHAWDFITPTEEVMRALDDLVRAGKVLYVGVSNAPAWAIARANTMAELRGWSPFVAMQIEYSLVERTSERELLPMARALDVGVTAWSPLGAGLLTGKYDGRTGDGAPSLRLDFTKATPVDERTLSIAWVVGEVARAIGATPAQVALAWLRGRGAIPLLGARSAQQFAENLRCVDLCLDAAHTSQLDDASRLEPEYPSRFLARENVRASVSAGFEARLDAPRR